MRKRLLTGLALCALGATGGEPGINDGPAPLTARELLGLEVPKIPQETGEQRELEPGQAGQMLRMSRVFERELPAAEASMEDLLLSPLRLRLTEKESRAVEAGREWRDQALAEVSPLLAGNGAVQFVFGLEQPSIVCSPLNVTDVELQRGEAVQSVLLGDTSRWRVDVILSGGDTPHLIIKPLDAGLATSMVVATDRRTYHMRLRSHRTEYIARVTFAYPQEAVARLEVQQQAARIERERETLPGTEDRLSELDFAYQVLGKAPWKPVRVYNDGHRTVIEMPVTMARMEAPSLLVMQSGEQMLVNYRVQDNRYIVDRVFAEGVLIAGGGRRQERVTIRYRNFPGK